MERDVSRFEEGTRDLRDDGSENVKKKT